MILFLAHSYDAESLYLYNAILAKKTIPVVLLIAEDYCIDYTISYSLLNKHHNNIQLLKENKTIKCCNVQLVINHWHFINPLWWRKAGEKDLNYVISEMNAFVAGWIKSFTVPVVNNIESGVLGTRYDMLEMWYKLAMDEGILIENDDESLYDLCQGYYNQPKDLKENKERLVWIINEQVVSNSIDGAGEIFGSLCRKAKVNSFQFTYTIEKEGVRLVFASSNISYSYYTQDVSEYFLKMI
jgi:hypothetical protein